VIAQSSSGRDVVFLFSLPRERGGFFVGDDAGTFANCFFPRRRTKIRLFFLIRNSRGTNLLSSECANCLAAAFFSPLPLIVREKVFMVAQSPPSRTGEIFFSPGPGARTMPLGLAPSFRQRHKPSRPFFFSTPNAPPGNHIGLEIPFFRLRKSIWFAYRDFFFPEISWRGASETISPLLNDGFCRLLGSCATLAGSRSGGVKCFSSTARCRTLFQLVAMFSFGATSCPLPATDSFCRSPLDGIGRLMHLFSPSAAGWWRKSCVIVTGAFSFFLELAASECPSGWVLFFTLPKLVH